MAQLGQKQGYKFILGQKLICMYLAWTVHCKPAAVKLLIGLLIKKGLFI